jgi:hypothetical protein
LADNKTRPTDASVREFLDGVENETRRADAKQLLEMMREVTGEEPRMWGPSIVGFGSYRYRYESGREGDWFPVGFSPRKSSLVVYIMSGFPRHAELMERLGKHRTGKSCLYINKLEDVDVNVLRELVRRSAEHVARTSMSEGGS